MLLLHFTKKYEIYKLLLIQVLNLCLGKIVNVMIFLLFSRQPVIKLMEHLNFLALLTSYRYIFIFLYDQSKRLVLLRVTCIFVLIFCDIYFSTEQKPLHFLLSDSKQNTVFQINYHFLFNRTWYPSLKMQVKLLKKPVMYEIWCLII